MFKRVLKSSGIGLIAISLSAQVLAAGQGSNSPVNHPATAVTAPVTPVTASRAPALAPAIRQLAAPVASSPWTQLHDELIRLSIASEQTRAAAGHVMAVGASVQAKTKSRPLTPAELALEQASRSRILDLISQVQHSQQNVAAQFSANQAFIDRHHFSARIAARQQATVARFDQASASLATVQQKLTVANSKNDHSAWHQGLEQLQQLVAQWQPAAPAQDAGRTPWTTPHLKVRAPHVDKSDYLQHLSMFDIKPLELAYAGNQPLPPGTLFPILPTMGESVVAGDTQASIDAGLTPAIQAEAAALNHNPAQIYHWVHDHIAYVPYYGSLQGADFTLQSRRGNDVDSASLLISLLRASNIPARYVYGTITVPVAQAKNWLGGVPDANAALSLLAQGGVPSQAVTDGAQTTAIQLEHVWVEAFIDYVPSQGTVQQQSDTWIPMDASYQQHTFTAPINIPAAVPFNAQGLLTQLNGSSTINANGQIQNLNSGAVQAAITSYQQNIQTWMSNYPGNTVGSVLGNSSTQPEPSELLDHNLPYTLTTVAGDFDSLPASLRWQWRLNLFGSATDQASNSPQLSLKGDLPSLLGHRLSIGFRPSTSDDSQVLATLLPGNHANGTPVLPGEYPQSVPAYLINMTPQLYEDGQLIADAGSNVTSTLNGASVTTPASKSASTGFPLGTPLSLESAAYDPASQNWQTATDTSISSSPSWTEAGTDCINSGETHVISLDSGMTSGLLAAQQATLDALSAQLSSGNSASSYDSLTGVLLQSIGANYFGLLDAYEQWETSNQSLVGYRRLSWARIATEVDAQYAQGIILSASFPGAQVRLDHLESALVGQGGAAASIPYRLAATERLSLYSQRALQNSLQTVLPNGSPVSAVHALATALNQGQALNDLNSNTYSSLITGFPQPLSAAENTAVTNAVGAGQSVVLNPTVVSLSQSNGNTTGSTIANAWTGRGLLYQNPNTGNSRFTVSNGATALWYDAKGSAWLAFASPTQVQNGSLPALTATRNLNVQLQTALGANSNLPWTQFTPANDLIDGDLLTQLNAQTGAGSNSNSQNLTSASPNLLPTAAGIMATDIALSQSVNINLDAPPQISSTPGLTGSVNVPYSYAIQASSPQGKNLSYSLVSGPSQVSLTGSGNSASLSWSKPLLGSWPITLRVSDGQTFTTQNWTVTVSQGAPALTVQLSLQSGQFVSAGSQVTVLVTTTGGLLPESAHLTVDGQDLSTQLLPGSTNGVLDSNGSQTSTYIATLTASSTVGNHSLSASVSDGNQSITQSSLYVVSADPANSSLPVASISAPEIDATLTSPTPITGTASATDLAYYRLLLKPVGTPDSAYVQIGKGTSAVTNGTLGSLDPSTLQNGIYTLALVVFNSQGQQTGVQQTIEIAKKLKLGQFRISFSDISITAPGGMPIQLMRTYDTTRSTQSLDFGYGWSATYQDVIIRKNKPNGQIWVVSTEGVTACLKPVGVHKIAITLPDGTLYNFKASNATQCQIGTPPLPDVQFDAIDNTAKLTANNPPVLDAQGGNLLDPDGVWNPTSFTLTLQNKTQYILDQTFGVQQIKDKFGNTLTFSNSGIQSSDGQGITFTRDPATNRITQVTDINGKSLQYAYDQNGNLQSVTDRLGNTSTFNYLGASSQSPALAHYLQSYTDGRGITVSRFEYDDSGRLTTSTDSQGRSTTLSYDTNNHQQSTKDKLGNVTTYTYDDQGNITQKLDALGNKWTYTYDANGNQTSQTDPLGHTTKTTYGTNLTSPGNYNQLLSTTDALGNVSTNTYDVIGNLTQVTDGRGNTTTYEYFGNGSIRVFPAAGAPTAITLDGNGNQIIKIKDGLQTRYTYDSRGNALTQIDGNGVVRTNTYDTQGDVLTSTVTHTINAGLSTQTTAPATITYTYDANKNKLTQTDPLGRTTSYTYDVNGKKTLMTDPLGHVTQYLYDANENLTQTIYPDGTSTSSAYDANFNKVSDTDQAGHVTTMAYDALNHKVKVTHPDGGVLRLKYDTAGNFNAFSDAADRTTEFNIDANNKATSFADANGNKLSTALDANGNTTAITSSDGKVMQYQYDAINRPLQMNLPNGAAQGLQYQPSASSGVLSNNLPASIFDENGNTISFSYDGNGKLSDVSYASNSINLHTGYGFDEANNQTRQTDANGHATYWQYDQANQLTGRTLPDGRQESFAYDSTGHRTQHADFDGTKSYTSYDNMGRANLSVWPDGHQSRYTYTATGQLASVTTVNSSAAPDESQVTGTTSYTYDVNNHLRKITFSDGRYIQYTYNLAGQIVSRTTADGNWNYMYDHVGNLSQLTDAAGKLTQYQYDSVGRLSTIIYPEGTSGLREYDANGRLDQITWQNGKGQLLNATVYSRLSNGQVATLSRYDQQSLLSLTHVSYADPSTSAVSNQTHAQLSSPAVVINYQYDFARRLIQESIQDYRQNIERITNWTYDGAGNRLTQVQAVTPVDANGNSMGNTSTTTTTNAYDSADQLQQAVVTSPTGSQVTTTFKWDAKGELIQKSNGSTVTTYSWTSDGRLAQASQGITAATSKPIASYVYDENGNRVQQTIWVPDPANPSNGAMVPQVTRFLVDPTYKHAQAVEEIKTVNTATTHTLYTWDSQDELLESSTNAGSAIGASPSYYEQDGQGSVITMSDENGLVKAGYSYSAFGQIQSDSSKDNNPYRYVGAYTDLATGLQYDRDRWYDQDTGRFVRMDSFQGVSVSPITQNHFIYADADPINKTDPSGFTSGDPSEQVTVTAIVGIGSTISITTSAFATGDVIIAEVAQQVAEIGVEGLVDTMSEGMADAYEADPANGARFLGQMVHKLTNEFLQKVYPNRFIYQTVGEDFIDTEDAITIELTTYNAFWSHWIKAGTYQMCEYVFYVIGG
jgi:RHS repeat-associated protein